MNPGLLLPSLNITYHRRQRKTRHTEGLNQEPEHGMVLGIPSFSKLCCLIWAFHTLTIGGNMSHSICTISRLPRHVKVTELLSQGWPVRVTYECFSLIGLLTATVASRIHRAAQPALLYLVPFTLLPLLTMAYLKVREKAITWH